MPEIDSNEALTIREIVFSIRIRDKDSSFNALRDILCAELTKFSVNAKHFRPGSENPIQEFIRVNIERSLIIRDNTQIYFLNYKEREGSLRIEFTLLVITSFISYAQIRQSLDNLIKDTIADYFEEILEQIIPVSITVHATDKEIVTVDETAKVKKTERPKRELLTRTMAGIALIISMSLAGFYAYNEFRKDSQTENAKLKEDYINLLLEKKIIEAVKDQKFTINLYKIADTSGTVIKTDTAPKRK